MFYSVSKHIINYCFTFRKWYSIFKRNVCIIGWIYISCKENKCIRIITKTWFNSSCFKFNSIALLVFTFCCLTVYGLPLESFNKFMIFCVSILYDTHRILWKFKSCFFWFLNDKKHCCSIIFKFANKINLLL